MENNQFRIEYDDMIDGVIDKIAEILSDFNLTIDIIDEGDGYVLYEIKKEQSNEEKIQM